MKVFANGKDIFYLYQRKENYYDIIYLKNNEIANFEITNNKGDYDFFNDYMGYYYRSAQPILSTKVNFYRYFMNIFIDEKAFDYMSTDQILDFLKNKINEKEF